MEKKSVVFQEPLDNAQVSSKWQIRQRTKTRQMEKAGDEESNKSSIGS
jgi:hypothetical protein